ncbi:MAG: hypothetical protein PHH43_08945 [Candidatus Cloacimonetes bacterium]|nr:hypothetical protein [Candidatus Cloacimonadota bacterium]MDD3236433.1 hypothetical protein [Candidatus Cloacimonadota bacterium]
MHSVKNVIRVILNIAFGSFSGMQAFMAPVTMLYLVRSDSILSVLTSLFSTHIHYFPLIIFLITLCFIIFMLIKLRLFHFGNIQEYVDQVIDINLSTLTFVIIALIFYAITAFVAYFYGISGALKPGLALLFKLFTSMLVFFHYIHYIWLQPFYQRQYGLKRSLQALHARIRNHKMGFMRFTTFMLVVIFATVRVYQLYMAYIIVPLLEGFKKYAGIDLRFRLLPFNRISDVFLNVLILFVVFIVSNILFSPAIFAIHRVFLSLNPIKVKLS